MAIDAPATLVKPNTAAINPITQKNKRPSEHGNLPRMQLSLRTHGEDRKFLLCRRGWGRQRPVHDVRNNRTQRVVERLDDGRNGIGGRLHLVD